MNMLCFAVCVEERRDLLCTKVGVLFPKPTDLDEGTHVPQAFTCVQ